MEYTLTYSEAVQGWVSFYSFIPEYMIGMNSYLYTFNGGNLYRHNTNSLRNNFYGTQYTSKIKTVFNDIPLENKLFKTLSLQGDDKWSATLYTDIQIDGYIEKDWFEKKEQVYFAFIRDAGTTKNYALRSINGIGKSTSIVSTTLSAVLINYSISPLVDIGKIVSVGDMLYYALAPNYNTPLLFGKIKAITIDYPNGINRLTVDATITGATVPLVQTPYTLYSKNSVAESHGLLGHYCVFELTNVNTSKVELFVTESEIMKSYP